jgi:uncharacterized membrane protein
MQNMPSAIKACQRQIFKLPIIGKFADQFSNQQIA